MASKMSLKQKYTSNDQVLLKQGTKTLVARVRVTNIK